MTTLLSEENLMNIFEYSDTRTKLNFRFILPKYSNKYLDDKIRIIQRFVRKFQLFNVDSEVEQESFELDENSVTKKVMIRYYTRYYPLKYYLRFPEFLVRKMGMGIEIELPRVEDRTKRDIINFLSQAEVSVRHIAYAGW